MNSVMATQLRPYPGSLISVTNKGEVCLFDPTASERSGLDSIGTYIIKEITKVVQQRSKNCIHKIIIVEMYCNNLTYNNDLP